MRAALVDGKRNGAAGQPLKRSAGAIMKARPMNLSDYLTANNLFILIGVLALAIVGLLLFLRKPANRHTMDGARGRALDEERAQENAQGVTDVPPTRQ